MSATGVLSRSKRRVGGAIHRFLFDNNYLCDEYFATSYIVPQRALVCVRITAFVYCATVLVSNLAVNILHKAGWSWGAYFTTLTYFGIVLYYWFAAYNTTRYLLKCRSASIYRSRSGAGVSGRAISPPAPLPPDQLLQLAAASHRVFGTPASISTVDSRTNGPETPELDHIRLLLPSAHTAPSDTVGANSEHCEFSIVSMPGDEAKHLERPSPSTAHQLSLAAQWILYELFTCYAPLVSLVYWIFLFPTQGGLDTPLNAWMGVSMHGVNTVLMGLEVFVFARSSLRWTHVSLVIGVLVAYLALVYLMVGAYGFYVYPFFESEYFGVGGVTVICAMIIDVAIMSWIVQLMVHRWRDAAYPRKWPPIQRIV
ncbi:hypothetical protein GGI21_001811 [Coemansia aciculifera]|nr:hypothetical protein GGI21_001811 [Coemansia aciculifera]